ncbi:MAG: MotA/TolQ/ExbB proton channel family protein [Opitutales bacterium]|nr:MotA/TolQ/ExbB proton channel family protein [Opitutales bacterium]
METLILGAGFFLWPLGFCSLLAAFVVIERLIALRASKIVPAQILPLIIAGDFKSAATAFPQSVAGRIVKFFIGESPDKDGLAAYARLEISRMERGLFLLDSVIAIAPLIGLFGTVYGLFTLFPENGGLPDQDTLTRGVGLALTTTMLGLFIAIPALFMNNLILRRIEILATRLELIVERLSDKKN